MNQKIKEFGAFLSTWFCSGLVCRSPALQAASRITVGDGFTWPGLCACNACGFPGVPQGQSDSPVPGSTFGAIPWHSAQVLRYFLFFFSFFRVNQQGNSSLMNGINPTKAAIAPGTAPGRSIGGARGSERAGSERQLSLRTTYLRKSNKTFLCQTKRGKAVHSLYGQEVKRDGEGSGEGERRTQSESQSRTSVSLWGGERSKPRACGAGAGSETQGLLGEQSRKQSYGSPMEGNLCPLGKDSFGFSLVAYGWRGPGASDRADTASHGDIAMGMTGAVWLHGDTNLRALSPR